MFTSLTLNKLPLKWFFFLLQPENLQKNRYPHALPYDHARVVLNELSNITGSDYINASTIVSTNKRIFLLLVVTFLKKYIFLNKIKKYKC